MTLFNSTGYSIRRHYCSEGGHASLSLSFLQRLEFDGVFSGRVAVTGNYRVLHQRVENVTVRGMAGGGLLQSPDRPFYIAGFVLCDGVDVGLARRLRTQQGSALSMSLPRISESPRA